MKNVFNKFCVKWIVISELVGIISALLSLRGMQNYNLSVEKPFLTPPGWVFMLVWPILYLLMGIGICQVLKTEDYPGKACCMNLFVAQLIFNFFWSLIFFNAQAFGGALIWLAVLWILVLIMTLCFSKVNQTAAWLQLPYLIWLGFAFYLNASVWLLNP